MNEWINQKPPSDLTAEKCLVASAILDPETFAPICAYAGGTPDFYSEAHRTIFDHARRIHEAGGDADGAAVVTSLHAAGSLEAIGGTTYLAEVLDSVPGGANWTHYLRLVTDAGRKRQLLNACADTMYRIANGASIEDAVSAAAIGVGKAAESRTAPKDIRVQDAAAAVIADLEAGKPSVFPTGLMAFDHVFGGIPIQGVTTFLGVPGSGKTSLAAGLALRISKAGIGTRIFSYEMSAHSVTANLLSAEAGVCVNESLRTGRRLNPGDMFLVGTAADCWDGVDLAYVEDLLTARQIEDRCGLYAARGVRCIVVDYIQNLPPSEPGQGDVARIEEGCRIMQRISRRYGMCVLMVSQMTGAAAKEDRPPRKSDGIGSAAIDQVSDCTVGVYRPAVFTPRGIDEHESDWNVRKQRAQIHVLKYKKGPCGAVEVIFDGKFTRFSDEYAGTEAA